MMSRRSPSRTDSPGDVGADIDRSLRLDVAARPHLGDEVTSFDVLGAHRDRVFAAGHDRSRRQNTDDGGYADTDQDLPAPAHERSAPLSLFTTQDSQPATFYASRPRPVSALN
jgi:hypothetical protein